MNIYCY